MIEESMTQRQVIDQYNMRKLENVSGGYYKMLEKGQRRKRQEIISKNKFFSGSIFVLGCFLLIVVFLVFTTGVTAGVASAFC